MGLLKDRISASFNLSIRSIGEDELVEEIYRCIYLYSRTFFFKKCRFLNLINIATANGVVDAHTCKSFEDWFEQLHNADNDDDDSLDRFKALCTSSPDFMLLSYILHEPLIILGDLEYEDFKDEYGKISVKSSDQVVLEMNKSAAITQSVVLGDIIDCIEGAGNDGDEIPLPRVSSLVLPKVISFCNKKHKFATRIERAVQQLKGAVDNLKTTVEAYETWIYGYVKANKPLLSYLHQAADYLHIPTLLELTSQALGDMKENTAEDISDWYAGLSLPRMLSPLRTQAYSVISNLDFFS